MCLKVLEEEEEDEVFDEINELPQVSLKQSIREKKNNQQAIFPARRPSKDFDEPLTGPRISMPSLPRTQVLVLEMIRGGTVVFLLFLDALASLRLHVARG